MSEPDPSQLRDKVHFWVTLKLWPALHRMGFMSCWFCGAVRPRDPTRTSHCPGALQIALRNGPARREPTR